VHKTEIPLVSGLLEHNDAEFLQTRARALSHSSCQRSFSDSSEPRERCDGQPKFGVTIDNNGNSPVKRLVAWFAIFVLTSIPSLGEASNSELMAGAAKVDITPPVGRQLWGQASRIGPSTGILDALYARVLVLKSSGTSLAIVVLDLGRTFGLAQMDEVRSRTMAQAGIKHVIFSATHTHSGPTLLDQQFIEPGMSRWEPRCLDAIVDAITRASGRAVPCHVGAGKGACYIGYNRQDPVGTRSLTANETRVPTVPIDPVVQVLRIDGPDRKPIAVLANYAAHPVVVVMENLTKYSADFPGAMCAYVEREIEEQPLAIFLQGACGISTRSI